MSYDTTGEDKITKTELEKVIENNIPSNNTFLVTAQKIRKTLKDMMETLWYPTTYTVDFSNDLEVPVYTTKDGHSISQGDKDLRILNVPRCKVINFPENTTTTELYYKIVNLHMKNVRNGDMVYFKSSGFFTMGTIDTETGVYNSDGHYIDFVSLTEISYTNHYDQYNNDGIFNPYIMCYNNHPGAHSSNTQRSWRLNYRGYYYDNNSHDNADLRNNEISYPFMYWDGMWYPVCYSM